MALHHRSSFGAKIRTALHNQFQRQVHSRHFLKKAILLFFFTLLLSLPSTYCEAAQGPDKSHFILEGGAYVTNFDKRLKAEKGYENKVSSIQGYVRLHPVLRLSNKFNFEPSLGTLVPGLSSVDGTTRTFITHLNLDLGLKLKPWFIWRLGPGIQWGWLNSKGGEVVLDNGLDRSTFYNPGQSVHYFLLTADSGFTINIYKKLHLLLDCYVLDIASKQRRTFEVSATLGIRL